MSTTARQALLVYRDLVHADSPLSNEMLTEWVKAWYAEFGTCFESQGLTLRDRMIMAPSVFSVDELQEASAPSPQGEAMTAQLLNGWLKSAEISRDMVSITKACRIDEALLQCAEPRSTAFSLLESVWLYHAWISGNIETVRAYQMTDSSAKLSCMVKVAVTRGIEPLWKRHVKAVSSQMQHSAVILQRQ